MLSYVRQCLTTSRTLWAAAIVCGVMTSLPTAAASIWLARPGVALLLTADVELATRLLPIPGWGLAAVAGTAALAGLVVWSRVFAVAIAASDLDDPDRAEPWSRSRAGWMGVLRLYVTVYAGLSVAAALLLVPASRSGRTLGSSALAAIVLLLVLRTILRIRLTLAARSIVLGGDAARAAWRRAGSTMQERRPLVIATWLTLAAVGGSLWIGGRLISPVLQETAFTFPAGSGYSIAREVGQLLLSVPFEAFSIALSTALWTALWKGLEPEQAQARRRGAWAPRVLAGVVVVTVLCNAVPLAVENAWATRREATLESIGEDEILPEDARRGEPSRPAPDEGRTKYDVEAQLEEDVLTWTTRIRYVNQTAGSVRHIVVHTIPAAYAGELMDIPLARDLAAADAGGAFTGRARPGTFQVVAVATRGRSLSYERDGTLLDIDLERFLPSGEELSLEVALRARLPRFPDRYGVWEDLALLGNWVPVLARRGDAGWIRRDFGEIGDPPTTDVADYRISIAVDEHQGVVGTGALTDVARRGDERIWTFSAPGVRDVAFAVGRFVRGLERRSGSTLVRSWYPADQRLDGAANLATAAAVLQFYERRFGTLPYDEVEVVETHGFLGGMEYPGVVFVSGDSAYLQGVPLLPDLVRYAGFDEESSRYVTAHEMAHQWWYATVGNDAVTEPWLDEAFAEVSARMWLQATGRDDTWSIANLTAGARPEAGVIGAGVNDFDSNAAYSDAVYLAGTEVLLELRRTIGSATFDQVLRRWFALEYLEFGTIMEFLEVVEEVGGRGGRAVLERYR